MTEIGTTSRNSLDSPAGRAATPAEARSPRLLLFRAAGPLVAAVAMAPLATGPGAEAGRLS